MCHLYALVSLSYSSHFISFILFPLIIWWIIKWYDKAYLEKSCCATVGRIKHNSQEVSHEPSENHDDDMLKNMTALQTRLLKLLIRNISNLKVQPCRTEMSLANTWNRMEAYSSLGPKSPTMAPGLETTDRCLSFLPWCYMHHSWPEK